MGAVGAIRAGENHVFDPLILAHVAGGGLILAFVGWRVVLRLRRGAPPPPENEPDIFKTPSHIAHWALCGVLVAMSVTGALAWFGDVTQAAQAHNVRQVALHLLAVRSTASFRRSTCCNG